MERDVKPRLPVINELERLATRELPSPTTDSNPRRVEAQLSRIEHHPMPPDALSINQRSVYVESADTLVISDLHLGRPDGRDAHHATPPDQVTINRAESLIKKCDPSVVVCNGDTFDSAPFSNAGRRWVRDVAERLADESGGGLVLIEGNHEQKVGGFAGQFDDVPSVETTREYVICDDPRVVATHGHLTPTTPADVFVCGHLHCTHEGQPCVLYGEMAAYGSDVVVLPAFTDSVHGATYHGPDAVDASGFFPLASDGKPVCEYEVVQTS